MQGTLKSLLQQHSSKASVLFFFFFLLYFTLQYCIGFAIHWHESTTGVHELPTLNPLPPLSPYHLSGSSQCTSPKHPVSCIKPRLAICFLHDSIYVSMPFSQIIPPSPSPTESKSLFFKVICYIQFNSHYESLPKILEIFNISRIFHNFYVIYMRILSAGSLYRNSSIEFRKLNRANIWMLK